MRVTLDRGLPRQQNIAQLHLGLVLIPDNDVELIRLYAERLLAAIDKVRPGQIIAVERSS